MTSKDIAEALGKPLRTVQDWIKATGAKSASIDAKSASSSSTYPADYTLAEVCQIIEEGMGADVANAYRTNAANAQGIKKRIHEALSASTIRELRLSCNAGYLSVMQFQSMIGAPVLPPAVSTQLTIAHQFGKNDIESGDSATPDEPTLIYDDQVRKVGKNTSVIYIPAPVSRLIGARVGDRCLMYKHSNTLILQFPKLVEIGT